MAINAADAWKDLATQELLEDIAREQQVEVVGVDIHATNPELVKKAFQLGSAAVAKLERADAA
jgi:hypothetical protein